MKLRYWITALALFILLGSACTPTQGTPAPGPSQVWIISPASGVILPPDPVNLKFEGASFVGITEFEIRTDNERSISVLLHVFHVVVIRIRFDIIQDVFNHSIDEGDIRT